MKIGWHRYWLFIVFAASIGFVSMALVTPAWGQASSRPAFTGEKVTAPNEYPGTAAMIDQVEVLSKQRYYVVVAKAGRGQWATRDYADRLASEWWPKLPAAEADRSVLIVLDPNNRKLSVHGGDYLQDELGFRGQRIDQEIVRASFIPHAKRLDYDAGLAALIPAIENWITRRERDRERRAQETKRRHAAVQAELRREAQVLLRRNEHLAKRLEETPEIQGEARADLLELIGETEALAGPLDAMASPLDPGSVTTRRQEVDAQREAVEAGLNRLRNFTRDQEESAAVLAATSEGLAVEEAALLDLVREDIRIGSSIPKVERVNELLESSRRLRGIRPEMSLEKAKEAKKALEDLREHRVALPGLMRENELQRNKLASTLKRLDENRPALEKAGLLSEDIDPKLETARLALDARSENLVEELATNKSLVKQVDAIEVGQKEAWKKHRFATRTVPLAGTGVAFLALCGGLAGASARRRKWKKKATEAFNPYNTEVVNLLDELDGFKRRHELLPFSDPDFTEPITGETLALYDDLEKRQEVLRRNWVDLMDKRAEAEALMNTETHFDTGHYRELIELLSDTTQKEDTESAYRDCVAGLERLEDSHETARAVLVNVEDATLRLDEQVEKIQEASRSIVPYEPGRHACATATDAAREALLGDPIGTRGELETTHGELRELVTWTGDVITGIDKAADLRTKLDEARATIDSERDAGLKLIEEEGNPDPIWDQGDAEQREALIALDGGDAEIATQHIESGFGCWEDALDRVKRQKEAREFCHVEHPVLDQRFEDLEEQHDDCFADLTYMDDEFDPDSWKGVADHHETVRVLLAGLIPLLDEAKESADADTQLYFHAADLLIQSRRRMDHGSGLLKQLSEQRQRLDELIGQCSRRQEDLFREMDSAPHLVTGENHSLVSRETLADWTALETARRDIDAEFDEAKPHWTRIESKLATFAADLAALQRNAESEIKNHHNFRSETVDAKRRADDVGAFLARHSEDRKLPNQIYQEANQTIDFLQGEHPAHSDWYKLLQRARDIQDDLDRAEVLGRKDIQLAQQASMRIREAQSRIRNASSFRREGQSANTSPATSALRSATSALSRREYETAIRQAVTAAREADQALAAAESRARAIRRRREEERRRAEARRRRAAAAAAAAAAARSRRSSSFGSSSSSSRSSGFRRSGSSRSSFGRSGGSRSGSSQSSW